MSSTAPSHRTTADEVAMLDRLLLAVDEARPQELTTEDLVATLGGVRHTVLDAVRQARMLGLITGVVSDRATVELRSIRLKPAGVAYLRRRRR